jgi:Flp pilus assembly CpaE family ATPase
VFVDLPKTANEKYVQDVLVDADVVICVVNQDVLKLEEFFNMINKEEILKDKNKIFIMGNYEEKSKYNVANIRSRYKIKEPIFEVPSNYLFTDACNDGNVIDFFYKNINADKRDYNGNFIYKVSTIAEKILEVAKIKDI